MDRSTSHAAPWNCWVFNSWWPTRDGLTFPRSLPKEFCSWWVFFIGATEKTHETLNPSITEPVLVARGVNWWFPKWCPNNHCSVIHEIYIFYFMISAWCVFILSFVVAVRCFGVIFGISIPLPDNISLSHLGVASSRPTKRRRPTFDSRKTTLDDADQFWTTKCCTYRPLPFFDRLSLWHFKYGGVLNQSW